MGDEEKTEHTSGQRVNKFNNSYRDISVIVAENNSLLKPKCQQYTSLNKMLSNFSKVLMSHISFTAVINNGSIVIKGRMGKRVWGHFPTENCEKNEIAEMCIPLI